MEKFPFLARYEYLLSKLNKKNVIWTFGSVVFLFIFYFLFFSAPGNFPSGVVVRVESGMSLHGVSSILKQQNIIRSRAVFESIAIIEGGEFHIISADYLFEKKLSVFGVVRRILGGEHHMAPVSVTIPEGFNINQIADIFTIKLANFNKDKFILEAGKLEGYLFPDTYFFLTNDDEESVLQSMSKNFNKKINPLFSDIASSGKTEKDIITMASIIEREAKGNADREIISGILWKRISMNMPLQVDAVMETYKTKGLPKEPIGNPGMLSIEAALHPKKSPYLYYLHDENGDIHYAKSFAEHKQNIIKYLK